MEKRLLEESIGEYDIKSFSEKYIGRGIYLYIDGKEHIDCASGTFNLPLGYSAEEIVEALCKQLRSCCHLSSHYTKEKSQEIFEQLRRYLPSHIEAFWFRDIIGSTANECAVRIAQKATGKSDIISVFLSHHGQSLVSTNISGNAFRHKSFSVPVSNTIKIPAPDCHNCFYAKERETCGLLCAARLNDFIEYASSGKVAAFIIEPILGNGGNIVPPQGYFKKIREICDKHGILIIADEVQTGFGRTGDFLASNGIARELRPDIITFAKGAGGIGIPVAGVMMTKALDILEPWEHSTTSGANPLALIAMEETIKYFEKHSILENVKKQSGRLESGLRMLEAKYPFIANVRGKGLMFAFDLKTRSEVDLLLKLAEQQGLILRSSRYAFGTAIKVRPPLIVTSVEIDEILRRLDISLKEFNKERGL